MYAIRSYYDGSEASTKELVEKVLKLERLWKQDLNQVPNLTEKVAGYLYQIQKVGMRNNFV